MSSPREEDQALYDSGLLFGKGQRQFEQRIQEELYDSKGSQRDMMRMSRRLAGMGEAAAGRDSLWKFRDSRVKPSHRRGIVNYHGIQSSACNTK